MRTPEAKVKDAVKKFLKEQGAWFTVGSGLATLPIDIIGCYKGRFFAIEVKAPGNFPTARQSFTMKQMCANGARCFWGDDAHALGKEVGKWMDDVS